MQSVEGADDTVGWKGTEVSWKRICASTDRQSRFGTE